MSNCKQKSTELTPEQVWNLFEYNAETGQLLRRQAWRHQPAGSEAGWSHNKKYRAVSIRGKKYLVHRVIWLWVHGVWPEYTLDHVDGDPLNNRLENLRDVPHQVNSQNLRQAKSGAKVGLLGVHYNRNNRNFQAQICLNGKSTYLGSFPTPEEAHAAYLEAKRRLHAGCVI